MCVKSIDLVGPYTDNVKVRGSICRSSVHEISISWEKHEKIKYFKGAVQRDGSG
jgi:hypothetical protein